MDKGESHGIPYFVYGQCLSDTKFAFFRVIPGIFLICMAIPLPFVWGGIGIIYSILRLPGLSGPLRSGNRNHYCLTDFL